MKFYWYNSKPIQSIQAIHSILHFMVQLANGCGQVFDLVFKLIQQHRPLWHISLSLTHTHTLLKCVLILRWYHRSIRSYKWYQLKTNCRLLILIAISHQIQFQFQFQSITMMMIISDDKMLLMMLAVKWLHFTFLASNAECKFIYNNMHKRLNLIKKTVILSDNLLLQIILSNHLILKKKKKTYSILDGSLCCNYKYSNQFDPIKRKSMDNFLKFKPKILVKFLKT